MIYIKSFLAGIAAFIMLSAFLVGAAYLAPLVMERLPHRGGGVFVASFPIWPIMTGLLLISAIVSYRTFQKSRRASRSRSRPL